MLKRFAFVARFDGSHWALLGFLLWALILSFNYWGYGEQSYVRVHDSADGRLATRLALKANLPRGEVGYWNWDMFAGVDRLAEGNSLEIVNILFYTLPGWIAYATLMFLQRFVAGYFTFQLLHKHFRLQPLVALAPSMFYALFPQPQINNQFEGFTVPNAFSFPGVPLALFVLGEVASRMDASPRRALMVSGLYGLGFAAISHFAFSVFVFPLIVLYLTVLNRRNLLNVLMIAGAFTGGWILLEGWEIWAAAIQAADSHRVLMQTCFISQELQRIDQILYGQIAGTSNVPWFVIGLMGLLFYEKSKQYVDRWVTAAIFLLYSLAAVLLPVFACSDYNPIGFLSGFNFTRFYRHTPFLLVVFGATGLEGAFRGLAKLVRAEYSRLLVFAKTLLLGGLIIWIVALSWQVQVGTNRLRIGGQNYQNLFQNPYLTYLEDLVGKDPFTRVAVAFYEAGGRRHPGFLWPYGLNTVGGYTTIYPLRYAEFWETLIDPMMTHIEECR